MYYVYIAHNEHCDKFYIGQTYDLDKRIIEHNLGLPKYTKKYPGKWMLKHIECFNTRHEAMTTERFLKKQKNKNFYKRLINHNHGSVG